MKPEIPAFPWRAAGDDFLLDVRLTPRAAHDRIDGADRLSDGRIILKARVRAVPEKGAANKALIKLVAKALDLPGASVSLNSGTTSRLKTLRLQGEVKNLEARLRDLLC
jgi:uncharacterized protein (TIGR00251 family)